MTTHGGYTGSYALNAITAPDQYISPGQIGASTIEGIPLDRVILDVANQPILWQLKLGVGAGSGNWEASEKYMLPGSRVIRRQGIVGVRIRAAIPLAQLPAGTSQAVVTVEAVT